MISLTVGPIHTLALNIVYALPPRVLKVHVQTTTGVIETSNDGVTFVTPMTMANGEFETSAPFIRSTTAASSVRLTPY